MKAKIIKYLQKYLPDILCLSGIWIWYYNSLLNLHFYYWLIGEPEWYKFLGVILITLSIDIAIRRYFDSKKK